MKTRNLLAITSIILLAVISRVIPHPLNFAPITAIALLGSVYYKNKWQSILIPMIIMFVSDLIIGLHGTIPFVYGAFLLITFIGFWLKKHFSYKNLLIVTLLSSVLFFLITNLWYVSQESIRINRSIRNGNSVFQKHLIRWFTIYFRVIRSRRIDETL